mgnify:CR=1 FL=1
MRVVSWNMKNKKDNWKFMMNQLSPDIALVQEANANEAKKFYDKITFVKKSYNPIITFEKRNNFRNNPEYYKNF